MKKRVILGIVLAKYLPHSAGHQLSLLHWMQGFRELGWDVWIVENLPSSLCRNASRGPWLSANAARWRAFVREYGYEDRSTLFIDGKSEEAGPLLDFAAGAELFLNYAGQFDVPSVLERPACRAYLDVDPGFTQTWAMGYACDMHLDEHDAHITLGCGWGKPWCRIPDTGHDWIATVPPVACSLYERRTPRSAPPGPWTTVTHWYGTSAVEIDGLCLRGKRESFLPLASLPEASGREFVVASDIRPEWEDYPEFVANGWRFADVSTVCESVESYLNFLLASAGELCVAKEGFASTRSGWLSDRSMAYLACGRPVVAMDTGWPAIIGEHEGLLSFTTMREAAEAIRQVEENYAKASRSALELSSGLFNARRVIPEVLAEIGIPSEGVQFAGA